MRHGGGRTGQIHNSHWAKLGVMAAVSGIILHAKMLTGTHLVMLALCVPRDFALDQFSLSDLRVNEPRSKAG